MVDFVCYFICVFGYVFLSYGGRELVFIEFKSGAMIFLVIWMLVAVFRFFDRISGGCRGRREFISFRFNFVRLRFFFY